MKLCKLNTSSEDILSIKNIDPLLHSYITHPWNITFIPERFGPVSGGSILTISIESLKGKSIDNRVMEPRCGQNCTQYLPITYSADMLNRCVICKYIYLY